MKKLILLSSIILALYACNSTPAKKITTFKLEISELRIEISELKSFLNGDGKWIITQDSIVCYRTIYDNLRDSSIYNKFVRVLSKAEAESITEILSTIDLNKFENTYVDHFAVDDMNEYEFTISVNDQSKTFRVYMVKIDEIFNLVKQINEFLPGQHKIGYDDVYFSR